MGILPADYWRLTPAEFAACIEGHYEREQAANRRTARICALLHNINRGKQGKKATEDDYMPKRKKQQTPEEMYKVVERLNVAYGGEVKS